MLAAVSLYRRIKSILNYKTVKKAQKNSQRIKLSKCAKKQTQLFLRKSRDKSYVKPMVVTPSG
ncbi:MAG: hypothetical protein K8R85_07870, partial [Bacteroidetes bacterium]|nr:hypothetical protein [Bacteroidota bacterium]